VTKTNKSSKEDEELHFDDNGLPISKESEVDDEEKYPYKEKEKPSFLKEVFKKRGKSKNIPVTFNVGLSVILFFIYLSVLIVGVPKAPILLLVILPTLYIIIRHIKLEREQLGEKFG